MTNDHAQAEAMIQAAIATDRRIMRARLNALDRLEAIALLGTLISDTVARFPADERPDIIAEFCDALLDLPDA